MLEAGAYDIKNRVLRINCQTCRFDEISHKQGAREVKMFLI